MDILVGQILQGMNKKKRNIKKAKMSLINNMNEIPRYIFLRPKMTGQDLQNSGKILLNIEVSSIVMFW
jgi:hypothetical protein